MKKKVLKWVGISAIGLIIIGFCGSGDSGNSNIEDREPTYESEIQKIEREREEIMTYIMEDYYKTLTEGENE